jgi:hypothetical protein
VKQNYKIELVEEYENVNFYSIHLDGEELTEMEAFFEKFPVGCEYDDEIDVIISWIDKFGNGGVKDATTWEESEKLAPYVKLLIDTSRFISSRISDGSIVLVDKEIVGNLNFTRYEKE